MSESNAATIQDSGRIASELSSFVSTVTEALERTDADESVVSAVEDQGDELVTAVEDELCELHDDVDENTSEIEEHDDRLDQHDQKLEHHLNDIVTLEDELADVEERLEQSNPMGSGEEDGTAHALHEDATPIERLTLLGEEAISENVTASVERAVTLFSNYRKWSVLTTEGRVLKSGDGLKKLLEAARDESLAWKQVYRACRCLERLSKGKITFFDHDRHGKMLCQHNEFVTHGNATNGSVTSSSVAT